jgi:hypothetical protein
VRGAEGEVAEGRERGGRHYLRVCEIELDGISFRSVEISTIGGIKIGW